MQQSTSNLGLGLGMGQTTHDKPTMTLSSWHSLSVCLHVCLSVCLSVCLCNYICVQLIVSASATCSHNVLTMMVLDLRLLQCQSVVVLSKVKVTVTVRAGEMAQNVSSVLHHHQVTVTLYTSLTVLLLTCTINV